MTAPTIDHEGSGALQYIRPDIFTAREIRLVIPDWQKYVALSNTVIANTFVITVPSELRAKSFDARSNLSDLLSEARSLTSLSSFAAMRGEAEHALQRLEDRCNDDVDAWAEQLARDVASHRE